MTEEAVSMDQLHVGDSPSSFKFNSTTIKAKLFCLFGTLFLLLALVFLCGSVAIQFGLQGMLDEGLREQLVISPEYKEAYEHWLSTVDSPAKQYNAVKMYNLTNSEDVIKYGAKPIYVELPKVAYRRLTNKFNVSFSRDMNTVDFRQQDYYLYDPVESGNNFDPYTNYVVNINPSFLGVMIQTGGESGLMKNMAGPAANQILETLCTEFTFQFLAGFRHQAFLAQSLDDAAGSLDHNMTAFVMTWSDASEAPNENFNYMLLSFNETEPTAIPIDVALQLWDSNVKYSFVTPEATEYQYWIKAQAGELEARKMLMDLFKLTDFQLDRIVKWFFSYDDFVVFPKIQVMFPVDTKRDLGWRQWGIGDTNPEGSVIDGQFGIKLPGIPEIKFFADRILGKQDYQMDMDLGKRIFNGTGQKDGKPLFDQKNALLFMDLYDKQSFGAITNTWNIDKDTATVVAEYFKYIMRTFVNDTLQTQVFDKQIGLVSRKTVHEWVFEYTDPLLMLLQKPELAKNATLMSNDTSIDETYLKTAINTVNTGVYNLNFVGDFIKYDGMTNLYMWNEPVPIHGTDGTRFQPNLNRDSMVVIWFPQVLRPQNFTYRRDVEIQGIKAFEYRLQKEMSDPNPIYNNDFFAMANLTALGSPIFVSKARFLHSEPWWIQQVEGVSAPIEDMDTTIYVEPTTGLSIYERKSVQINAYIQNRTVWFDSFHPNVPTGIMYPLAIIEEYSDIPEVLANKFKNSVYLVMNLRFYGFWAAIAIASLFAIISSVLIYQYYSLMDKQKKQYQALN